MYFFVFLYMVFWTAAFYQNVWANFFAAFLIGGFGSMVAAAFIWTVITNLFKRPSKSSAASQTVRTDDGELMMKYLDGLVFVTEDGRFDLSDYDASELSYATAMLWKRKYISEASFNRIAGALDNGNVGLEEVTKEDISANGNRGLPLSYFASKLQATGLLKKSETSVIFEKLDEVEHASEVERFTGYDAVWLQANADQLLDAKMISRSVWERITDEIATSGLDLSNLNPKAVREHRDMEFVDADCANGLHEVKLINDAEHDEIIKICIANETRRRAEARGELVKEPEPEDDAEDDDEFFAAFDKAASELEGGNPEDYKKLDLSGFDPVKIELSVKQLYEEAYLNVGEWKDINGTLSANNFDRSKVTPAHLEGLLKEGHSIIDSISVLHKADLISTRMFVNFNFKAEERGHMAQKTA